MDIQEIEYQAEGQRMVGQLAIPDGDGPRPGVLVAHEGPGIDDNAKNRARRLTELGYVTFALDYIGDGKRLDGMPAVRERLGPLREDPWRIRALGQAGLDVLTGCSRTDSSRLAAIGHCFGGTMALELARGGAPCERSSASTRGWGPHAQRTRRRSPGGSWCASAPTTR